MLKNTFANLAALLGVNSEIARKRSEIVDIRWQARVLPGTTCSPPHSHDNFVGHVLESVSNVSFDKGFIRSYPLQFFIGQADAILHPHLVANSAVLA